MPKYAVKIGEIILTSDKPITDADRKKAIRELLKDPGASVALGNAIGLVARVNGQDL